jgi:TRAP-type uncharacterized transport system substrate-binding protein
LASAEPQSPPSAPRTSRPDPERLSLYLVTQAEVRSLADLDGKPVALGAQGPALEKSIREAFANAHVTPNFVGGSESDALGMVANGEAMAAPLRVAARETPELTEVEKALAATGLRLLQLPLDVPASPQGSRGLQP